MLPQILHNPSNLLQILQLYDPEELPAFLSRKLPVLQVYIYHLLIRCPHTVTDHYNPFRSKHSKCSTYHSGMNVYSITNQFYMAILTIHCRSYHSWVSMRKWLHCIIQMPLHKYHSLPLNARVILQPHP